MVPARATAASAGPAPQLGLAAEGEAFVSVQVLYLLPMRVSFFALFPLQISSSQVVESPLAYKPLNTHIHMIYFSMAEANAVLHAGDPCTRQPITPELPHARGGLRAIPQRPHCHSSRSESLPSLCSLCGHVLGVGKDTPLATGTIARDGGRLVSFPRKQTRTSALLSHLGTVGFQACARAVGQPPGTCRGRQAALQHGSPPGHPSVLGCMDLLLVRLHF